MPEPNDQQNNYKELVLVPIKILKQIQNDQQTILNIIQGIKQPTTQKDKITQKFISESKAKEMLGKGTTWFFNQRKSGKLKARKMGGTNYYTLEDIEKLFGKSDKHVNQQGI